MKIRCPFDLGVLWSLLNFTASKYVLIKDWRLGIILRVLQVGILIYVLTDIFQKASYLTFEVPTGSVTAWPDGLSINEKITEFERQHQAVEEGKLRYCNDPDEYHFHWNEVHHGDFKCSFLEASSLFINGESQVFVTTSMRVEKIHYYTKPSGVDCEEKDDQLLVSQQEGACAYAEAQSYFPIRPEDITLNFMHSYRTSRVVNKIGTLPETIIKAPDFSDNKIDIKKGNGIKLTLNQLLQVAGIDLDKRLDEQENNPCKDPSQANITDAGIEYPYARLSGLTLQLTFNYYTRKLAPEPYNKATGENSNDVICIVEVVPQNRWSLLGSEIRQMMNKPSDPVFLTTENVRGTEDTTESELLSSQTDFQKNGIALVFTTSGSVGRFDISSLINALVAGSVLLAVAQVITTYVAIYFLGVSSELYKAFMKETVDWRQEYARYAAQAIVAGHAFTSYDSNKSMKLDRKEIFDVLNELMRKNKNMEEWQLAALADFLMRQGERSSNVQKGRFDASQSVENYIDIEEWIDIFTEEKANWPALQRLIIQEYPDEASREGVMKLLRKSATKRAVTIRGRTSATELSGEDELETDGTPVTPTAPESTLEQALTQPFLSKEPSMRDVQNRRTSF